MVLAERRRKPRHVRAQGEHQRERQGRGRRPDRRRRPDPHVLGTVSAGAFSIPWDGRDNDGAVVPDGMYDVRLVPVDGVANLGTSETISVRSIALLGAVKTSRTVFYPQDRDALGSTSVLSFAINRQATVTWTIRNAAGDVVDTRIADERP